MAAVAASSAPIKLQVARIVSKSLFLIKGKIVP
jgi:hypothetical protein